MTYAGVSTGGTSGLTKIAGSTLGAGSWQVDFTSIPGTYSALLLLASARTQGSSTETISLQFNGVTTSGYYTVANKLIANAVTSTTSNASTMIPVGVVPGTGDTGWAGSFSVWMPGYASTSNRKSIFGEASALITSTTSNWTPGMFTGMWSSVAAITSISILTTSGNMVAATSSFSLYGFA